MNPDPELLKILLGGGGGAGVVYAIFTYFKDRRKDRVVDEDTALGRLNDAYEREKMSAKKAWRLANWYRSHYSLARDLLSPEEKKNFPPVHPEDIDY